VGFVDVDMGPRRHRDQLSIYHLYMRPKRVAAFTFIDHLSRMPLIARPI
jgi:hypothetical protein